MSCVLEITSPVAFFLLVGIQKIRSRPGSGCNTSSSDNGKNNEYHTGHTKHPTGTKRSHDIGSQNFSKKGSKDPDDRCPKIPKTIHSADCAGPCFVWEYLGSIKDDKHEHDISMRHLNDDLDMHSKCKDYLTYGNVSFSLCDTFKCMCSKCYLVFMKHRNKKVKVMPYWYRIKKGEYKMPVQCARCKTTDSARWSPLSWITSSNREIIKNFFFIQDDEDINFKIGDRLCNCCHKRYLNFQSRNNYATCKSNLTDNFHFAGEMHAILENALQSNSHEFPFVLKTNSPLCTNCYHLGI